MESDIETSFARLREAVGTLNAKTDAVNERYRSIEKRLRELSVGLGVVGERADGEGHALAYLRMDGAFRVCIGNGTTRAFVPWEQAGRDAKLSLSGELPRLVAAIADEAERKVKMMEEGKWKE